jgi:hypothetical protein
MTETHTKTRDTARHWLRWAFLGVVLLLFLAMLGHVLWGSFAERRLEAEVARLRAAGEPMTLEQLPLPSVPDDENASLDYQAAGRSIGEQTPRWQDYSRRNPGQFELPLTDFERATFDAIVAENAAAMKLVAGARGKQPSGWRDQFTKPYVASRFDLSPSRRLGELLRAAAYAAHSAGRDDQAVDHLQDMLRLSTAATYRPGLIGHLVAIGISRMAATAASAIAADLRIGSGGGGADRARVESLIAQLLQEREIFESRRLGLQSERVFELDMCYAFVDGDLGFNMTIPANSGQRLIGYALKPLAMDDARQMMKYIEDVINASQAQDWPAAKSHLPTTFPAAVAQSDIKHIVARLVMPSMERVILNGYSALADRRLAATALAIRLYALDHDGQLPPTLEALSPKYLPAAPIDPMSGQPLRYVNEAKNPRIYSVGQDGIDDGGKPAARVLGNAKYGWKGDEVVSLIQQPRAPETTQPATTEP